jgi:hypothetical protein
VANCVGICHREVAWCRVSIAVAVGLFLVGCDSTINGTAAVDRRSNAVPATEGKVRADPNPVSLGQIFIGTEHTFSFSLSNDSPHEVNVQGLNPGCACIDPTISSHRILPGQCAKVTATLRALSDAGSLRRNFRISFTDHEEISAVIVAEVAHSIVCVPESVRLAPDFRSADPAKATITVKNNSVNSVEVVGFRPMRDTVRVELPANCVIPPSQSLSLSLIAGQDAVVARDMYVQLLTTDTRERHVVVRVEVMPITGLRIEPDGIRLGVPRREDLINRHPLEIKVSGPLLDTCSISIVKLPGFLRLVDSNELEERPRVFRFAFAVEELTVDLSGAIEFGVSSQLDARRVTVSVPTDGFLSTVD